MKDKKFTHIVELDMYSPYRYTLINYTRHKFKTEDFKGSVNKITHILINQKTKYAKFIVEDYHSYITKKIQVIRQGQERGSVLNTIEYLYKKPYYTLSEPYNYKKTYHIFNSKPKSYKVYNLIKKIFSTNVIYRFLYWSNSPKYIMLPKINVSWKKMFLNKNNKYLPAISFSGMRECFKVLQYVK